MKLNLEHWEFTCEYLVNPIGIDNLTPRFSWFWQGEEMPPAAQKEYHIVVYDETDNIVWDSGKNQSEQNVAIEYEGMALQSAVKYKWLVEVLLEDGSIVNSAAQYFETALLGQEEWRANWIGSPRPKRGIAPLLRRSFWLENQPENARLYLSGLGYAETTINGIKPDESRLDPGWTDYAKTVLYRTWDIANLLHKGENVIAVELGEGWHGLEHEGFMELVNKMPSWLSYPKLLCRLVIDGEVIVSAEDGQWLVAEGPVIANSIYDGEDYDARREKNGWRTAGYVADADWTAAIEVDAPEGKLRCQLMPPIAETQKVKPYYIDYPATGENVIVVDMGVNISGWIKITMTGKQGGKIRTRYAEVRHADGHINQSNLRGALATDTYIFGETEEVVWAPRFTYHGFRYVEIDYTPGVVIFDIEGICVNTNLAQTGFFESSNKVLNESYKAVIRTECNNLHSVPTDCPQRDERLGWLNDVAVRCEETIINFDTKLFFDKWLQDILDAQDEKTGALPDTAPYFFGDYPGAHPTSTFLLLPWYLYLYTGDTQPMRKYYSAIKKYVDYKMSLRAEDGLIPENIAFGDWAAPMRVSQLGWGLNAVPANIRQSMLTSCYMYLDCTLVAKFAKILGIPKDAAVYRELAEHIKQDINSTFLQEGGYYSKNSQGENAFALYNNLVPLERRNDVIQNLLRNIREENNWHVTTGNQMTKYLFEVLGNEGLSEDAFKIASSEEYPSIGFMLKNGATTIWERWENLVANQMNSHDHPMLGAYSVWFQKYLVGIRPEWNMEKGIIIRVAPSIPAGLDRASASLLTGMGRVACSWKVVDDSINIEVAVPWNAEVFFTVPTVSCNMVLLNDKRCNAKSGENVVLKAGRHILRIKLEGE